MNAMDEKGFTRDSHSGGHFKIYNAHNCRIAYAIINYLYKVKKSYEK